MTPDRIRTIREATGLTPSAFADLIGLKGTDGRYVRALEAGEGKASGPIVRILELIERGEMPKRYYPEPKRRGRPPIASNLPK